MSRMYERGARVSGTAIYSVLLAFLLFTVFLLPSSLKPVSSMVFGAMLLVLISFRKPSVLLSSRLPVSLVVSLLGLLALMVVSFVFSPWNKGAAVIMTAFLILAAFIFGGEHDLLKRNAVAERVFYCVGLAVACCSVSMNLSKTGAEYTFGAYDKNYFGIILFLFFCWCWLTRRRVGVLVCILSAIPLGSRNYVVMLAMFVILFMVQRRRTLKLGSLDGVRKDEATGTFSPVAIFTVFVAMLVAIVAFSTWWGEAIVGTSTTPYGESVNDSSNAVRLNSNRYAVAYISEHPELLIYGYDSDITRAMGLIEESSLDGTETTLTGTFFDGYRVVQPHHAILNMLLKAGVLFTIAYFAALSCILSRYLKRNNAYIWAPFLFACMLMHSLLINYYLVFLLVLLSLHSNGRLLVGSKKMRDSHRLFHRLV